MLRLTLNTRKIIGNDSLIKANTKLNFATFVSQNLQLLCFIKSVPEPFLPNSAL